MIILLLAALCSACGDSENQEDENVSDVQLVSVEELIEASGINPDDYSTELLQQFIKDFEITEDNVTTLNIPLLLKGYSPEGTLDVSDILSADMPERSSDFTKDAVAVAFLENRNTDTVCAYYDFESGLCYKAEHLNLFTDLNQVEPEQFSDSENLVSSMDKLGVFSWSDSDNSEGIEDSQTMILAVKYSDGSIFRITVSGILANELPATYTELKEFLIG